MGEVFTPDTIVMDMISIVDREIGNIGAEEYISKTYLEPACGDGQFLIRILSQKMERIQSLGEISDKKKEILLVKAICSIYGVDIQHDNVAKSIERMYRVATGDTIITFDIGGDNEIRVDLGITYSDKLKELITWILNRNIVHGDALEHNKPVILTDYLFNEDKVTIVEFPLNDLTIEMNKQAEIYYLDLPNKIINVDNEPEYDF